MACPRIDKRDAAAVLQELRRRGDAAAAEHFHRFELDADEHLTHLFWADAESRGQYAEHGDVVVFDTTFRANRYGVPFIPFVGMNHHREPVVFSCGVTQDRSLESLVWLLRAFALSSNAQDRWRQPRSVITDGGDAVAAAVKVVFPETSHRACAWHVESGVDANLRHWASSARTEFRTLAYEVCSPPVFEQRWHGFVARHGTASNKAWLDAMYGKRDIWAAAFVHDKFFLGMAGDQRTECLATALHTGLHEGLSLLDLLEHADACDAAARRREADLDRAAAARRTALTTAHRHIEARAAWWFSPANFLILREEINMVDGFEVVETRMRGHPVFGKKVYTVAGSQDGSAVFHVTCSQNDDDVRCSCRKMEREGLPCRHILRVMRHTDVSRMPGCCLLRRMRRRLEIKAERLLEMEELGRRVFDLASEDAHEFQEIKAFLEDWLEQKHGDFYAGVAPEDDAAASAEEGGTPIDDRAVP